MDFSKASLAEMRQFTKDNGIKGCSAMKKKELADFLTKYVEEHVTAVAVDSGASNNTNNDETAKPEKSAPAGENNSSEERDEATTQTRRGGKVTFQGRRQNGNYQQRYGGRDQRQGGYQQGQRQYRQNTQEQRTTPATQEHRRTSQSEQENKTSSSENGYSTQNRNYDRGYAQQEVNQPLQNEYDPELDSGKKANGILEVMPEGYGFIRSANYLPGDQDIYVSPVQIRRIGLKTGDIISGSIRLRTQGEKFSALLYIDNVNGLAPEEIVRRKNFEDLTPIFPNERIQLDGDGSPIPIRMINLLSPIGKGQRGMIVSPPKTGKTTLIKQIAKKISTTYKDMHLLVLLIDERPEEVTDIRESIEGPNVEVIYSTFDELPEHHKRVSEMVIERAKRLVESKKDVVILLDSITRLARAYNLTVAPSGRTLSGGLDPAALHMPKRFFGAARNMREGGSLTILATALVDTGSKMDDVVFEEFKGTGNMELVLDRRLSEKRIFPAIDIAKSGTRRDDLLLSREEQEVVNAIHKELSGNKSEDVLEDVRKLFIRTKNNQEFIHYIQKTLLRRPYNG